MISEKIIVLMLRNEIISDEDKEIYLYGLHQGFVLLGNLLTMLLIGYLFDSIWEVLIFCISYIPLRSYAGGYHARTGFRCYVFSVAMILVFIYFTNFTFWNGVSLAGTTLISALIITLLAPVEDKNKPLDKNEKQIYRTITYMILCIIMGLNLFVWILKYDQISISLTISIAISAVMLLLGKVKNKIETTD